MINESAANPRAVLERVLSELCESLDADAGILTSAEVPVKVIARYQRRPILPPVTELREPVCDEDGTPIGELRIVWRGRRLVSRSSRRSVRWAARWVAVGCVVLLLPEEPNRWVFDAAPVALWAHDFSALVLWARERQLEGVDDFRAYMNGAPDAIAECVRRVAETSVNPAARSLFADVATTVGERSLTEFVLDLAGPDGCAVIVDAILRGEARFDVSLVDAAGRRYALSSQATSLDSGGVDYSRVVSQASRVSGRFELPT